MRVRLRALRSFSGLEGRIRRGREFSTSEHRADYLISHELAARLDVGPTQRATDGPSETKPSPGEPVHVGGGWYEWNGKRYRGRDAAHAARG